MGSGARRPILVFLILVMILGFAVYFKLWFMDYRVSYHDAELLRKQFDIANREAMDESAEWRLKFDTEKERAGRCMLELSKIKRSSENKAAGTQNMQSRLEMLQKENVDLLERLESLKQELDSEKLKCGNLQ
ncbi:hypothetical protein Droror1_Dr00026191 [Drosera rotundifolia]